MKKESNNECIGGFLVMVYYPSEDTEEPIFCDSLAEAETISEVEIQAGNLTKIFKEVG